MTSSFHEHKQLNQLIGRSIPIGTNPRSLSLLKHPRDNKFELTDHNSVINVTDPTTRKRKKELPSYLEIVGLANLIIRGRRADAENVVVLGLLHHDWTCWRNSLFRARNEQRDRWKRCEQKSGEGREREMMMGALGRRTPRARASLAFPVLPLR